MKLIVKKLVIIIMICVNMFNNNYSAKAANATISQNYTWNLARIPAGMPSGIYPGSTSSINKTENNTGSPMKKHISQCTTFYSATDSQNNTSYIKYTVQLADASGHVFSTSSTLYHTRANSYTHTFASNFVYGTYCWTRYHITGSTSAYAHFSGNFYFSN